MESGTVVWFSPVKGYGFIKPDDADPETKDVFVHYSGVNGDGGPTTPNLHDGQKVTFERASSKKGVKAVNVSVVGDQVQAVEVDP